MPSENTLITVILFSVRIPVFPANNSFAEPIAPNDSNYRTIIPSFLIFCICIAKNAGIHIEKFSGREKNTIPTQS